MTINFFRTALTVVALTACDQQTTGNHKETVDDAEVVLDASLEADTTGLRMAFNIKNRGDHEVCFSSGDLRPGSGRTSITRPSGDILNEEANLALETLRGVNVAEPVVVLRPRQEHIEWLDLSVFSRSQPLIINIEIAIFRCSDLFDRNISEVHQWSVRKAYRVANNQITGVAAAPR